LFFLLNHLAKANGSSGGFYIFAQDQKDAFSNTFTAHLKTKRNLFLDFVNVFFHLEPIK